MSNLTQKSIYFLYYFVFVTISFFNQPYLIESGIDASVVGFAFYTSLLFALILMILLGIINDNEVLSHRNSMLIAIVLTVISSVIMVLSPNLYLKLIAFMVTTSLYLSIPGIMDGLVLDSATGDYGTIRSLGSFGAAVSYFVSSVALGGQSFTTIVLINCIVLSVMFFSILKTEYQFKKSQFTYKQALKITASNKNILLIVIITLFTYGVLKADDSYNYIFSTTFAMYTSLLYGVVGFFSIVFEGTLMNIYRFVNKKISDKGILSIAAITLVLIFFVKATLYSYTIAIVISDLALGLFVGLFVPTAIAIINNNSEEKVRTSILTVYQSAISLGGVIFGYITTIFVTVVGEANLPQIYFLHTIIILVSFVFIFLLKTDEK